ncbi:MAG: hypothetical protein H8E79_00720 [Desulfobulbaceae bacterium]|uniref:Glutamate dehydrogenase n=1 Tax=Candidatus Desulfatifera sulfidica TaxID=2841691 RepID=A0A8J6NA63_9BACT|nr:hypothetical protein [Candidatus Desulfatifera sulfidica]
MENVQEFMAEVVRKYPGEFEFHQAVEEVAESLAPFLKEKSRSSRTA